MNIEKDDYFIALYGNNDKPKLFKARKVKSEYLVGVVPDNLLGTAEETTQRFVFEDILAVLGKELQQPGSVYGCKLEPFYRRDTVKRWGIVDVYRNVQEEELQGFYESLRKWGYQLNKKGLLWPNFETEIRPSKGRYAGFYHFRPKHENDLITFHPKDLEADQDYLIVHELGHNFWYRLLPRSYQLRWVKLFNKASQIKLYDIDLVSRMLKDLRKLSGQTVREIRNDMNEEDAGLYDRIIDWILSEHVLKQQHLDMLLLDGNGIKHLLPKPKEIEYGDQDILVSEYGSTAPEELFAESWAMFHTKQSLPDEVEELLQKSIKIVRG